MVISTKSSEEQILKVQSTLQNISHNTTYIQ